MKEICLLCGASRTRLFLKEISAPKGKGFSITLPTYGPAGTLRRCGTCDVVFVDPLPIEKTLLQAYAEMQDPHYIDERGRTKASERVLRPLEKRLGKKGKLLDVGCFYGVLLSDAKSFGWEVEGVEPSRWARQKAKEQFGLDIRYASLKEAAFPAESFDAVTAIDVFEHFLHPQEELQEINRILKKGGLLYLSTPDVGSVAARLFHRRWWGYRPEHLFYFSRRSLNSFLVSSGFEPVWEGFYWRSFTVSELLRRLEGISPWLARLFSSFGKVSSVRRMELPVNLFDRIALIARKGS